MATGNAHLLAYYDAIKAVAAEAGRDVNEVTLAINRASLRIPQRKQGVANEFLRRLKAGETWERLATEAKQTSEQAHRDFILRECY